MKNFVENKTLVFFIKFFIVILILIAIFVFYDDILNLFIKKDNENVENFNSLDVNNTGNSVNTVSEEISPVNFNLVATGDILCHNTQYFDAYDSSTGTYDFNYVFDDVVKYIEPADIAISSLETSFAGSDVGYSNYPRFNSPDSLITAIKNIGVDIISTAGNHCLDYGFSGLSRTIDVLDYNGLSHLGTYKS